MPYFYEQETPVKVESEGGIIEYYPEAKKLSVSRPYWTDAQGVKCRGKTVTLSIDRLKEQSEPLIELLNTIIAELMNERNEL